VNVFGQIKEIFVVVYQNTFEFALKERTLAIVFFVEVFDIGIEETPHEDGNRVFFGLLDEKMEVIGHKTKSKQIDFVV
jgi:hypothetical protein